MIDIQQLKSELDRTQLLLQDERAARQALEARQSITETQLSQQQQVMLGAPQVQNMIRNGDIRHSWDSYFHNPSVADDTRFEAWNIYRNAIPSAGQQLKEDSVYSGVLVANSKALPDAGRSDTPNVDPDWDKTKGIARLGSTSTIDFPLPANLCYPGKTVFCGLIAAKRSANVTVPGGLYAGIWDNTAGQRNWLPAGNFAITATVVGTPAATTSRDYLVVARTDWGRTISSAAVTVAAAPSNGSFISGSVYVKLAWTPIPGVIAYDIYRKTGATYDLLASESVANGYFDQGAIRTAGISGYPSTTGTNAIAYVAIADGLLDRLPVDGVAANWQSITFAINIPATYNLGNTTDKQWLRIGWTQALTGADATRGVLIDLVYLSNISGTWAHHPDDEKGVQNFASTPNGSTQGGAGSGGGGFEPPDPGTGIVEGPVQ